MPLTPGSRIGPYEIVAAIGAGGMGEVYRARDTTLHRDVAIKVLPEVFARDPERLARFEREARTLAALNHPHIAQVYGVESGALVMEFVDGEDLAERIARAGAIPIEDALPIALQIAQALEAAHEQGIIHRDLKPANIKVRPDGTVKVLDFGLAKALDSGGTDPARVENSPTMTSPLAMSNLGVILGTAAYMAPEQARGKAVDKRADIWAFGCVLYEMLTGRRAFGGETITDILAAVVKEEPDWTALPPGTPAGVRDLTARCLVKDPKQRLRDVGDARIALEQTIPGSGREAASDAPAPKFRHARVPVIAIAALGAAVAAAASLATWMIAKRARGPEPLLQHFALALPEDASVVRGNGGAVAVSPDGRLIVFVAQPPASAPVLYRRRIESPDIETLRGTTGAFAPFFSPDSRWIGFFTDKYLMKIPADGGAPTAICERTPFSRAAWAADGTIVLGTSAAYMPGALARVSADGGTPAPLTRLEGKEALHQLPFVLPDGRHVVFTVITPDRAQLAWTSIDSGAHTLLNLEGSGPFYAPPGHLLFAREDGIFDAPFDAASLRVTGVPVHVLDDAHVFLAGAGSNVAAALSGSSAFTGAIVSNRLVIPLAGADSAGSIVYLNRRTLSDGSLLWLSESGASVSVRGSPADFGTIHVSPDGRRAAVSIRESLTSNVWLVDLARGTRLRLTSSGGGGAPIWTPDGSHVTFAIPGGTIGAVATDGSGSVEPVLSIEGLILRPDAWSPDGSTLIFTKEGRGGARGARNRDIAMLSRGAKPVDLLATSADEHNPALSPDGQWLAYVSNASGRDEVYVRKLTGGGATVPVSSDGGEFPIWAPGGKAVYYSHGDHLMRASIEVPSLQIGAAAVWGTLPAGAALAEDVLSLDVGPDGRFLTVQRIETQSRDTIHVVLNWGQVFRRISP